MRRRSLLSRRAAKCSALCDWGFDDAAIERLASRGLDYADEA